jgi:hypothetical protein
MTAILLRSVLSTSVGCRQFSIHFGPFLRVRFVSTLLVPFNHSLPHRLHDFRAVLFPLQSRTDFRHNPFWPFPAPELRGGFLTSIFRMKVI